MARTRPLGTNCTTPAGGAARLAAEATALERGEPAPAAGPLDGITLHSLRHSFAGVAEQLGATIPTIAALLGHRVGGVTGGYILKRVDVLLVDTANRVAKHIEMLMRGEAFSARYPTGPAALDTLGRWARQRRRGQRSDPGRR